ncbi:MAG TPA: pyridoxal phosphate-dependent aminotransferase, partial [Bacillota bacterium]
MAGMPEQDRAGTLRLATRVAAMAPSPTVSLDGRVKELRSQGVDIINFTAGEPDFPTPEPIKAAARAGLDAELTKYTPVAGTPDLRRAITAKLARENGLTYDPAEVVVSAGGKHVLYNAFMVLCDPGDEVIVPAPYWVSYPEQVRLAGATPVFVPTDPDRGFHVDPDAVARAVTPRTRAVVLNSPNNPTGAVMTAEELAAIAALARRHDLWVISDEIYEHLVYDGRRHVSIAGLEGMKVRTILVNGLSKAYAMTGWRVGYAAAPRPVAQAMAALQGHVTSGIPGFIQAAAVAALEGPIDVVQAMAAEYDR